MSTYLARERASAVRPEMAMPMWSSTLKIFFWYDDSSFAERLSAARTTKSLDRSPSAAAPCHEWVRWHDGTSRSVLQRAQCVRSCVCLHRKIRGRTCSLVGGPWPPLSPNQSTYPQPPLFPRSIDRSKRRHTCLTASSAYSTWCRRPWGLHTVTSVSYWLRNMALCVGGLFWRVCQSGMLGLLLCSATNSSSFPTTTGEDTEMAGVKAIQPEPSTDPGPSHEVSDRIKSLRTTRTGAWRCWGLKAGAWKGRNSTLVASPSSPEVSSASLAMMSKAEQPTDSIATWHVGSMVPPTSKHRDDRVRRVERL